MKKKVYTITFILLPFLLAFPGHFVYEYVDFPLFALYFPVNESVFEHTKLLFTPIILTFLIFYFMYKKKTNKEKLLSSLIISITSSTVTMLTLYYLSKLIFDKENMIVSISTLLIGITFGQILAILSYKKDLKWSKEISLYSLITITVIYLIFTLNPPQTKFFYDKEKMSYGIESSNILFNGDNY